MVYCNRTDVGLEQCNENKLDTEQRFLIRSIVDFKNLGLSDVANCGPILLSETFKWHLKLEDFSTMLSNVCKM